MSDSSAFAEELEDVALTLGKIDLTSGNEDATKAVNAILAEYQRLDMAATMFELNGVAQICKWVVSILNRFKDESPETLITLFESGHFTNWIEFSAQAVRDPEELSHLSALTTTLMGADWPVTPSNALLEEFLLDLRPNKSGADSSSNTASKPSVDQNALDWDPDIHPELLDAYLQETPKLIADVATLIRTIAQGELSAKRAQETARIVHTIKGASAVVGAHPIADFAHKLEDLFELDVGSQLEHGLDATLEASADCLEAMFDNLSDSKILPQSYLGISSEIDQWLETLSGTRPTQFNEDQIENKKEVLKKPQQKIEAGGYLSIPIASIQTLLNLAGELITSTSLIAEQANQANEHGKAVRRQEEHVTQMLSEMSETIDRQYELRKDSQQELSDEFENLELEVYNDLHSIYGLLNESIADNKEHTENVRHQLQLLSEQVFQQQRMQRRLSDIVLQTRLVPVSSMVARLERVVRETCRSTGKQASIEITGQNQHIDTDILRKLAPALLHLIRNAVDHGIETPKIRAKKGKPEEGAIRLSFDQQENTIHIELSDDGQGLNVEQIRTQAIEQALITESQDLSDEDLLRLTLRAGFTTRKEVTEISGRGVGMDVVQNVVENLQGLIRLNSEAGKGMQVNIQVPLTLIATNAMLARIAGNIVAIPGNTVQRLLYVSEQEVIHDEGERYILHDDERLKIVQLAQLLGWQSTTKMQRKGYSLLVIESESGLHAVEVEELMQPRDIVVKNITSWFGASMGVTGACILADGKIAAVLDPLRLLRNLEQGIVPFDRPETAANQPTVHRRVLIVDDSLSNRKSLSIMVEQLGYEPVTAVDGMDALHQLESTQVELILVDLEMPRVNGLEMTETIRDWPEQRHVPIAMITSRTTNKHREMARKSGVDEYLTKPVDQQTLSNLLDKWLNTKLAS